MPVPGRFTRCHQTSGPGVPVRRVPPPDIGYRAVAECRCAGSSGAIGHRMPGRYQFGLSGTAGPVPLDAGCLCTASPVLVGQNLYMQLGHLHS